MNIFTITTLDEKQHFLSNVEITLRYHNQNQVAYSNEQGVTIFTFETQSSLYETASIRIEKTGYQQKSIYGLQFFKDIDSYLKVTLIQDPFLKEESIIPPHQLDLE